MPAATSVKLGSPPRRDDLVQRLDAANRWTAPILIFQLVAIVTLGFGIDWNQALKEPLVTAVAIGAVNEARRRS